MLPDIRQLRAIITSIIVIVALTACSLDKTNERLWLEAPDWSRAQYITLTASVDRADMTIDDDGNIYVTYMVVAVDEEEQLPGVIAISPEGQILWQKVLDAPAGRNHDPQLIWDGNDIYVFWLLNSILYASRVDRTGTQLDAAVILSGDVNVEEFTLARARPPKDQINVWYAGSRQEPGLYALEFSKDESDSQLVDSEGIRPSINYDIDGNLHAAWARYLPGSPEIQMYYAIYPGGVYRSERASNVITPKVATTSSVSGPYLGVEAEETYLFWSIVIRSGLMAGQSSTNYIHFPSDQPELASFPSQVEIPASHELQYIEYVDSDLNAGTRVDIEVGNIALTTGLRSIYINPTPSNELVVSFQGTIEYTFRKQASQVGLSFYKNGQSNGYQLLSFTSTASRQPTIISDDSGDLYLTWLEPFEGQSKVFFASTSPNLQKSYRPLTMNDIRRLSVDTLYGLTTGAILTPIAFVIWAILPVFLLIITGPLRRGDNSLRNPLTLFSLGLAVIVFQAIKYFSLPGIEDHVPFSAWLPLPSWSQAPVQFIIPLFITIVAIITAWWFTYRRQNESPFYFLIIYLAVDSLLTMAVYGGLIYGAF